MDDTSKEYGDAETDEDTNKGADDDIGRDADGDDENDVSDADTNNRGNDLSDTRELPFIVSLSCSRV